MFVAWIPLLIVEQHILKQHYRSGKVFIHAYLTFFIYNIGTTWWVWNASEMGSLMAFFLNTLLMSIVFYAFHLTKKYVGNKEGFIALFMYWVAFEYFHYNWDSSWPWLNLGNIFSILPSWVQWYSYTGVLGGTLWILVLNLLLFRILDNVYRKKESWGIQLPLFILAGLALFVPLIISLFTYYNYEEKKNPVNVVAIQPNIDPYNEKFEQGQLFNQLDKIINLARKKVDSKTDLIVAPETSISESFEEDNVQRIGSYNYILNAKRDLFNVPWFIGASTYKFFEKKNSRSSIPLQGGPGFIEYYNTSLYIDKGNHPQFIHKSKLVPGVETIPFSQYFPFLASLTIDNGGTSVSLGIEKEPSVFRNGKFTLAPVICYESVFGEFVSQQCMKGAEIICIATNDGWWKDTPGYLQHMSFARLRAIENRRSVVRSANTGRSCLINQRGDVIVKTGWWVPAVISGELNLNSEKTFYTQYGDVMGRSFGFFSILLFLFMLVKRFKKKYIR